MDTSPRQHGPVLQVFPMVLPDHKINPRVSCKVSILPRFDGLYNDRYLINSLLPVGRYIDMDPSTT